MGVADILRVTDEAAESVGNPQNADSWLEAFRRLGKYARRETESAFDPAETFFENSRGANSASGPSTPDSPTLGSQPEDADTFEYEVNDNIPDEARGAARFAQRNTRYTPLTGDEYGESWFLSVKDKATGGRATIATDESGSIVFSREESVTADDGTGYTDEIYYDDYREIATGDERAVLEEGMGHISDTSNGVFDNL